MKKVLYVPLDDRDCNYDFPYQLSLMTDCLSILRPERALMGSLKRAVGGFSCATPLRYAGCFGAV